MFEIRTTVITDILKKKTCLPVNTVLLIAIIIALTAAGPVGTLTAAFVVARLLALAMLLILSCDHCANNNATWKSMGEEGCLFPL